MAILEDLHEEDHFALLQFDSDVLSWKKSLTKATKQNVAEAKDYARSIRDNGGQDNKKFNVSHSLNFITELNNWQFAYFVLFCQATNINQAMLNGINMLKRDRQANRLPERSIDMIILLTDGMPNFGKSFHTAASKSVYISQTFFTNLHCENSDLAWNCKWQTEILRIK